MKKLFGFLVLAYLLLSPFITLGQESSTPTVDVANLPGTAAVYIKLPDGKTIEKNADRAQSAYSTIKLWVAAGVMKAVEEGSLNLSATHTVLANEKVSGTGNLVVGRTYSYDELLGLMLTHSDNTATNILIRSAGGLEKVNALAKSLGSTNTRITKYIGIDGPENLTSAKDGAIFMENLVQKKIVSSTASDKILAVLTKRSELRADGIYLGRKILSQAQFLGKSGVGPQLRNDIATFKNKAGGQVFAAVLLTDLQNTAVAEEQMSKIGQQVFDGTSVGTPGSTTDSSTPISPGDKTGDGGGGTGKWCTKVGSPAEPNPCVAAPPPLATNSGGISTPPGEFPFYCQGDKRWAHQCALGAAGCGPTSMAMVISYFEKDKPLTPPETDALFRQPGRTFRACGNVGSSMTQAIDYILKGQRGYTTTQLLYVPPERQGPSRQLDLARAQEYLNDGYLIIGSVPPHIYVIDQVDVNLNRVHLRDPARCVPAGNWNPNGTPWIGASGTGYYWFYAYAVKK